MDDVVYCLLFTHTLPLTHLMEVGSSSNNHDLSVAGVAQVRCQLPLSGPVPAHVEEYLDDDEYDDDSAGNRKPSKLLLHRIRRFLGLFTHMYQYSSMIRVSCLSRTSNTCPEQERVNKHILCNPGATRGRKPLANLNRHSSSVSLA